jgi:hypothetical protein
MSKKMKLNIYDDLRRSLTDACMSGGRKSTCEHTTKNQSGQKTSAPATIAETSYTGILGALLCWMRAFAQK